MEEFTIKKIAEITNGVILCGDENVKISGFCTASKECNETLMFVPVIGEHVDGHNYILDAVLHGAKALFTSHGIVVKGAEQAVHVHVKNTVEALQKVAKYYRNKFSLPVIGVTGSVGKTTVKEMIAMALSGGEESDIILKTIGNMNSQIGLAQMMLYLNKKHMTAVIEMGMSKEGEMEKLSYIAAPSAAVITNIGVAHIANLHTRENILKAKMNIINHMQPNGILLLNKDDVLLADVYYYIKAYQNRHAKVKSAEINRTLINKTMQDDHISIDLTSDTKKRLDDIKVYSYGLSDNCDYQADNISMNGGKTEFIYRRNFGYDSVDEKIEISVLGKHNVLDALAALAIADIHGSSLENAKAGLYKYKPLPMRGNISHINDITIIDDTYNASTDSMKSGIDVLYSLPNAKRRIVIFADILELGEASEDEHRKVGKYASGKNIDIIITIGNDSRYISLEAKEHDEHINTMHFNSKEEAMNVIMEHVKAGDICYFKGSRGMKLDETVSTMKKWLMCS